MSTIRVRQLTKPTDAELDMVAVALAEAFKSDVFMDACIGGDQKFQVPLQRATVAAVALGGELWVADYGEHEIVGAAGWYGPGRALLDSPDQGEAGFNGLLGGFSPKLMEWWMKYFMPKYNAMTTTALGDGKKLAAWHLQALAVLPDLQNKGIGRSLVNAVESKVASAQGVAMCLEAATEKNVAIYKHWGYELKGQDNFESDSGPFTMYSMIKGSNNAS